MLRSLHASARILALAALLCGAALSAARASVPDLAGPPEFRRFVEALWPEARARGVSRATFERAFAGLSPDPKILALTHQQSEFVRPIWDYLGGAVSSGRLERGRVMAARYASTLAAVERTYGVPRTVVLGVWGMETNFGSFTGSTDVVRALATLAYARYRGDFFRGELLAALQILQRDHIDRRAMRGSWAGAMGQTQFMPSSFLRYAVDGDRDGRRDIWASVPDALASTANYLRQKGWERSLPWGFEVRLPQDFDFRNDRHAFAGWHKLGVRRADGKALPPHGEGALFLPAGANGPAFLVTDNYAVIKAYNSSDAYALAVAHLGDRLTGGRPIAAAWPVHEPPLGREQREEVQRRLAALGHYEGDADGRLGSKTRAALRAFQLRRGLKPDGYATVVVLRELRAAR
jgi:membrane-bound lytic murein transglycosylase B